MGRSGSETVPRVAAPGVHEGPSHAPASFGRELSKGDYHPMLPPREHGIREVKDLISREILAGLEKAGIGIASTTIGIVGMPQLRVKEEQ